MIPAAAGLRQQGAGKGATSAFLISTPETGADSIAATYALLDPVMTLLRPVAAFFTAAVSGLLIDRFDPETDPPLPARKPPGPTLATAGCSCGAGKKESSLGSRALEGLRYAFGDLLGGIGHWFLIGVLIAGFITALIPPDLLAGSGNGEILTMLLMIVVSVPLYVCATGSIPIAAALAAKGLSPGAVIVFLLAGPATNAASITVVAKILGKKATAIYLFSIVICSLLVGLATNRIYIGLGLDITGWIASGPEEGSGFVSVAGAALLLGLILRRWVAAVFTRRRSGKATCNTCGS